MLSSIFCRGTLSAQVAGLPLGRSAFPMMLIDEEQLGPMTTDTFPQLPWLEATRCLSSIGWEIPSDLRRPGLVVVPFARTFRVHDVTRDSLLAAVGDTSVELGRFTAPTIGYALLHSNVVLVTEKGSRLTSTLRHEALHFILWRLGSIYGHPTEFFDPCDRDLHS